MFLGFFLGGGCFGLVFSYLSIYLVLQETVQVLFDLEINLFSCGFAYDTIKQVASISLGSPLYQLDWFCCLWLVTTRKRVFLKLIWEVGSVCILWLH